MAEVALSIQQPWAWLIVNGHKAVENRTWRTRYRGRIFIHAGKKLDREADWNLRHGVHPANPDATLAISSLPQTFDLGGLVGEAEVVDCVTSVRPSSYWFTGPYGFLLRNARPLPFLPCKGALGFFHPKWETL